MEQKFLIKNPLIISHQLKNKDMKKQVVRPLNEALRLRNFELFLKGPSKQDKGNSPSKYIINDDYTIIHNPKAWEISNVINKSKENKANLQNYNEKEIPIKERLSYKIKNKKIRETNLRNFQLTKAQSIKK